jgi:exosortase/archaeosortase family protein
MSNEVDKLKILLALIVIFQGMTIALLADPLVTYTHPAMRLFGLFLIFIGCYYIYFKYKQAAHDKLEAEKEKDKGRRRTTSIHDRLRTASTQGYRSQAQLRQGEAIDQVEPKEENILARIMNWTLKKGEKFSNYTLPIIGAVIIDAVIIYNILINRSIDLAGFDAITIAFGISLIIYNYIPTSFGYARDFLVFFLGLVFFILVFPPIFYDLIFGSGGNAIVTKIFLADPLTGLLNAVGIESSSEIIDGTAYVFFPLAQTDETAQVGIAEGCSGIYTVSIFLSAFITFVLLEYKKFDRKVGLIIVLGIFTSYIANILRMFIIILVSHYYDNDPGNLVNLSWMHVNAGWMIFLAWIIPFWWLMYRYLMKGDIERVEEDDKKGDDEDGKVNDKLKKVSAKRRTQKI